MLSIEETIYIGHALCSAYRIDETALGGISHREGKDKPLTSAASLARFLDTVPGFCGSAKARRALAYVRDNARSPMESALAMGFGLPVHFGGFGLGEIRLNQPIRLFDGNDSGSRRFVTRIPDLTISARGRDGARRSVLVDFDADSVHASRKGLAKTPLGETKWPPSMLRRISAYPPHRRLDSAHTRMLQSKFALRCNVKAPCEHRQKAAILILLQNITRHASVKSPYGESRLLQRLSQA